MTFCALSESERNGYNDENGLNGDVPLPVGLDEPNGNPNANPNANSDTDAKIEALQQQLADLERRLDDRE